LEQIEEGLNHLRSNLEELKNDGKQAEEETRRTNFDL